MIHNLGMLEIRRRNKFRKTWTRKFTRPKTVIFFPRYLISAELENIFMKCNLSVFHPLESENLEATAQFDFNARSERELSFKKGDTLTLYTQVSNDWWRGALAGREGLIPDKYIMLKIKLVLVF